MSCEVGRTCSCIDGSDCNKVKEELADLNLGGYQAKSVIADDDSSADSSSDYTESDSDYCMDPWAAENEALLEKEQGDSRHSRKPYIFSLKEEYKPKDYLQCRAFHDKFFESVEGRSASESKSDLCTWSTDFRARLTEDELEKLRGMEEVEDVEVDDCRVILI